VSITSRGKRGRLGSRQSDRVDNIRCCPRREIRSVEAVDERHRKIQVSVARTVGTPQFMNLEEEARDSNVTRADHKHKRAKGKEAQCTGTLIGAKCDDGPVAICLYSGGGKETPVIRFDDFWIRRCSSGSGRKERDEGRRGKRTSQG
jgi:hypothetical protein